MLVPILLTASILTSEIRTFVMDRSIFSLPCLSLHTVYSLFFPTPSSCFLFLWLYTYMCYKCPMLFSYSVILTLPWCYDCIVVNGTLQMLLTLFCCDVFIYPPSHIRISASEKKNSCIIHPYFHMLRPGYSKTQVQYIKTCALQTNFWNKLSYSWWSCCHLSLTKSNMENRNCFLLWY